LIDFLERKNQVMARELGYFGSNSKDPDSGLREGGREGGRDSVCFCFLKA